MRNCWLSPEGEVIFCDNHDMKAWDLIEERYGVHRSEVKDPSIFLGEKRWMAYHNRSRMVVVLLFKRSDTGTS